MAPRPVLFSRGNLTEPANLLLSEEAKLCDGNNGDMFCVEQIWAEDTWEEIPLESPD